jgi:hypothetical protein
MTTQEAQSRASGKRTAAHWALALSTIIGVVIVEAFAFMQVMGTAGCSDRICAHQGPGDFTFALITYGAPVVAVAAIVSAFFTARRRGGWLVPVIRWALLIVAFVILMVSFRG